MSETMGFLHPSPHCHPPCAPFPPPHGCRRPTVRAQASCRRRGRYHPQPSFYQRRCRFLVVRATGATRPRHTTPAVKSPCVGTALTRLISRSTPYLTFL